MAKVNLAKTKATLSADTKSQSKGAYICTFAGGYVSNLML